MQKVKEKTLRTGQCALILLEFGLLSTYIIKN